ncbi:hypothetical protein ACP4OV_015560 [Aristida adscensionis]
MNSRGELMETPLLEEDNAWQENAIEHTGDGSVCIRGHPASKKHTGKWEGCSLTIGNDDVGSVSSTSLIYSSPYAWPAWTDIISYLDIIFFVGLYMVAIGYGAQKPCLTSFGADQFDDTDEDERTKKGSFFNWQYFILNVSSLISGTIIVWVQENEGWLWGFTISAVLLALGVGAFLLGFPWYRFQKPGGSPIARVCQVIVAATSNLNKDLPCDRSLLYEIPGQVSAIEGSRKLEHTTGLEFFDKAAIVTSTDVESATLLNKWRTCTVTQVEELKILIRILPIGATMILFHTVLDQMFSTFVEQGTVMDRHIGSFEIPTASFQCIDVIAVLSLVPVYERIIVPTFRKFTGMANGITPLQRIGIGLVCPLLSMVSAALVESHRLRIAQAKGLVHQKVAVPMSILWQGPQYFLIGAGEVFSNIGLTEFFYEESPDAMRSLCLALSYAVISSGKYLNSFIISLVPVFTARGGSPGWIPDNLNEGHLDRFCWMMAGLCLLNLLPFAFLATRYKFL